MDHFHSWYYAQKECKHNDNQEPPLWEIMTICFCDNPDYFKGIIEKCSHAMAAQLSWYHPVVICDIFRKS